ncbi:hypothetical protein [uncultured Anaerococcus sp.]|nr:hypothetical protein [uncultured Anaerococcus sp.]
MKKFRFLILVSIMFIMPFLSTMNESLADDEDIIIMVKSTTYKSDSI